MFTRWGKFWIAATAVSLLLWDLRWLYGNILTVYTTLASPSMVTSLDPLRFWVDRVLTGFVGNTVRLAGPAIGIVVLFLLWKPNPAPFDVVKRKVSVALVCEASYWLLVLPISLIELLSIGRSVLLEVAFVIQILVASPMLIILAAKIWIATESNRANTLKWAALTGLGYLVGIWCNNVFRWFSMAQITSIAFILTGTTGVGFVSALAPLSISLFFAFLSFHTLFGKQNAITAIRMAGVSLVFLGLYYVLYLIYSAVTNSLSFVFLVEFWPVTVLGLGVGMLRGKI